MKTPLQPGEPFNPFRMFTGLFIPEGLVRCASISPGAKLAWGRLARYAGENGLCYPSVSKLAAEIGVGERQAQRYLSELEQAKLIRRVTRFDGRAQTSNHFEFLWHELFQQGISLTMGEGVTETSPRGVTDPSPKESHSEESPREEGRRRRRLRLSGHEPQKSRFAPGANNSARCKQYPALREAIARYMQEDEADEVCTRVIEPSSMSCGRLSRQLKAR